MLQTRIIFLKTKMQHDIIVAVFGLYLVFDTYPTMTFIFLRKINGSHCICKGKEHFIGMLISCDTFFDQCDFVIQHFSQTCFSHIASIIFHPIDGVTKVLIISRHGFCNRTRTSTSSKKLTNGFLTSAYLGKGTIDILIKVDAKCLGF